MLDLSGWCLKLENLRQAEIFSIGWSKQGLLSNGNGFMHYMTGSLASSDYSE